MSKGKIIVLDGVDASGKETQAKRLKERFEREGKEVRMISFPDYDSPSSSLVKMYLGGTFGDNANNVNPYAVATFFAIDRYAYFNKEMQDVNSFIENGGYIIFDRYVSSNAIHQASKISDEKAKKAFLLWLYDLEYNIYKCPRPDTICFLNMPPEFGEILMKHRPNKITGEEKKDIHEKNLEYLQKSYKNAMSIAKFYGWKVIDCVQDGTILTIEEINDKIYDAVL